MTTPHTERLPRRFLRIELRRSTWLATRLSALRAGRVTLQELP
jgi:hypothetical protein